MDLVVRRQDAGKEYGIVLVPEGLIEFIPEVHYWRLLFIHCNLRFLHKYEVDADASFLLIACAFCLFLSCARAHAA